MADKKYTVIRTDNLSGTKQPADLLSVRVYDADDNKIEVENGTIVKVGALEAGEREIYKATLATASDKLDDCAIIAGVEVSYDERNRNLEDYINEAGKPVRAYIPRNRNFWAVTAEGFVGGNAPAEGDTVGIGAEGKLDASATGVGKCVAVEQAGRYTLYVIQNVKA